MEKEKICEMVIREMIEYTLNDHRKQSLEEQQLQAYLAELSRQMQEIMKSLREDERNIINEYIAALSKSADHDCIYLYMQGAKDCVDLLKKLSVIKI